MMKKIALYLSIIAFSLSNTSLIHTISKVKVMHYSTKPLIKGMIRRQTALSIAKNYPDYTKRLGSIVVWNATIEASMRWRIARQLGKIIFLGGLKYLFIDKFGKNDDYRNFITDLVNTNLANSIAFINIVENFLFGNYLIPLSVNTINRDYLSDDNENEQADRFDILAHINNTWPIKQAMTTSALENILLCYIRELIVCNVHEHIPNQWAIKARQWCGNYHILLFDILIPEWERMLIDNALAPYHNKIYTMGMTYLKKIAS